MNLHPPINHNSPHSRYMDGKTFEVSPMQKIIISLLLQSYSNKEIAEKLMVGTACIKHHLRRLYLRYQILDGRKRIKLAMLFAEAHKNGKFNDKAD